MGNFGPVLSQGGPGFGAQHKSPRFWRARLQWSCPTAYNNNQASLASSALMRIGCIVLAIYFVTPVAVSAQTFTVLDNFPPGQSGWSIAFQGADGNLYGISPGSIRTNHTCSPGSCGGVFDITMAGLPTTLYSFNFSDGGLPAGLVQGADGNFYGTAAIGGSGSGCFPYGEPCGAIFKLTSQGALTTLYDFSNFGNPFWIIEATDGNLYGTYTTSGIFPPCGGRNCGGVFKLTPAGTLTTLYAFCSKTNCEDGSRQPTETCME